MTAQLPTFDTHEAALAYLADPRFGPLLETVEVTPLAGGQLVEPYRTLLNHHIHMTTVLEKHHGRPVELSVIQECRDDNIYSRLILLTARGTDCVVETGIARLNLTLMSDSVRREILAQDTPLGDILIRHNVLRRIEPLWFLKISGRSRLLEPFGPRLTEAYGRIGIIHCDDQPAIELLEIVTGQRATGTAESAPLQ